MNWKNLRRDLIWLGLLMACLMPVSCLLEDQGEIFLLDIKLPESVNDSDYLVVFLADTSGQILDSLYEGRAEGRKIRKTAPHYLGGEALVVIQEYQVEGSGDTIVETSIPEVGRLTVETRIRIDPSRNINETLPPRVLQPPEFPSPEHSAVVPDTHVVLRWMGAGKFVDPQPEYRVHLGLGNPPAFHTSVPVESLQVGPLLRDTLYFWQVETRRAGNRLMGPVWSFWTLPYPPASLAYPESQTMVGKPMSLQAQYTGGGTRTFTVEPNLPAGLRLDAFTGLIHGTPVESVDSSRHEVTVENAAGRLTAVVILRILRPPPLEIPFPEGLREADSIRALIIDTGRVWSVYGHYAGPVPEGNTINIPAAGYGGGEAEILIHGFRGREIAWEFRYRLNDSLGILDSLPPYSLPVPRDPKPGDGASDSSTTSLLSWQQDAVFLPLIPVGMRVHLGTSNPPPLLKDSLYTTQFAIPPLLQPDTVYFWRVGYFRAGDTALGPIWSFRTRPLSPESFSYPPDSLLRMDVPASLVPVYSGGRARFRIAPPLPPGLAFDTLTGRISGKPSAAAPRVEYVVTASNASGSMEAKIFLRVDYRMVRVTLPEDARKTDSAAVFLVSTLGNLLDTLWGGPVPEDLRVGRSTSYYDGIRAELLVLGFREGRAVQEYRYSLTGTDAAASPMALQDLALPANPSPAETTAAADTVLDLGWTTAPGLPPSPRYNLYLGHSNPPPLFSESLSREGFGPAALRVDTLYYWRVEVLKAGRSLPGPVWSFRTRPAKPLSVEYGPAVFNVGEPAEARPVYAGGGRVRFKVAPGLPEGLALDSLTGRISGVPKAVSPGIGYAVTATNPSGRAEGVLDLHVLPRVIDFLLPDTAEQSGRVLIELRDSTGTLLHTLLDGEVPEGRHIRALVPDYGGGEATVHILGFKGSILHWESRRRVNRNLGVFALEPLPALPATSKLSPENSAEAADTGVDLEWSEAGNLSPPAMAAVYLGLTNPPPPSPYRDSIAGPALKAVPLKPDTTYYWTVETVRDGRRTAGSVWSFRTPTSSPSFLSYPAADSILWRDSARTLSPSWKSGRGTRFSVAPALPNGLSLDSLTGVISGKPLAVAARTAYVVTIRNSAGSLQVPVTFRVGFTANLVARWDGDEGSGSVLVDSAGGGYHGTLQGISWVPGVKGKALSFDGTAWARIPVRDALQVNGFTISLWFKQIDQSIPEPLLEYSEPDWVLGININTNTTGWGALLPGTVFANIRPSDANPSQHGSVRERNILWTDGEVAGENQWNHVAVTFSPRNWKMVIYVNGRQEAEAALQPDFLPLSKGRIHLGFRPTDMLENDVDRGFRGAMDQVEIFDGALDSAGVAAKYRSLSP